MQKTTFLSLADFDDILQDVVPAFDYIVWDVKKKKFSLVGQRCRDCSAYYLETKRISCASCYGKDCLVEHEFSDTGKLHVYSIVKRSYPGITVPYISAIVDLDGGGTIKGNLVGVLSHPDAIDFGMPVTVEFGSPKNQLTDEGKPYVVHYFKAV